MLDDLVERRVVERVPLGDPSRVVLELEMASRHLESARVLAVSDPELAYTAAYDAARKALAAHMRARGFRPTGGPGKHVKTLEYGRALARADLASAIDDLDAMRQLRHGAEYEAVQVTCGDVEGAIATAEGVVAAIHDELG